ncbi:MAG: glutathione S-transferase [Deltaproteobacteria bacterium]|jgi:glutathione S-transferase|nr:glutathione S-transferase [Deltaproteobacteria bacterium]MBT6435800.1 glutathione S-transferase [Deltaproteobacteria bacterium]MBT6490994.1 glutathione S-transferase [Deltaproteobacteria bacterium]
MIKLHHLETSRSTRLLWLLEELELPYELVVYKRDPKTIRAPDSLKAIHPLGRSPLLEIDGKILAESGAIMTYLTQREGKLGAPNDDARVDYNYWLHYAEGSAMTPLMVKLLTTGIRSAPVPFFIKPLLRAIASKVDATFTDGELTAHFGWIETALSHRAYFAGEEFSAADIQMSYPIQASFARAGMLPDRPNTSGWLKRVESREAFKKAVEKGGEPILTTMPS